ncbi:MAG: hypothetical protein LC670_12140 [Flavobacteriales bacterium]|nr:hypothetical protein [Flavobacteriales bacterium]
MPVFSLKGGVGPVAALAGFTAPTVAVIPEGGRHRSKPTRPERGRWFFRTLFFSLKGGVGPVAALAGFTAPAVAVIPEGGVIDQNRRDPKGVAGFFMPFFSLKGGVGPVAALAGFTAPVVAVIPEGGASSSKTNTTRKGSLVFSCPKNA